MKKIKIWLHQEKIDEVLLAIQKLGLLELSPVKPHQQLKNIEREPYSLNYEAATLESAVQFLMKFETRPILRSAIEGIQEPIKESEIKKIVTDFDWTTILKNIVQFETTLNHLNAETKEINNQIKNLEPWIDLKLSLDQNRTTKTTITVFATGQSAKINAFYSFLSSENMVAMRKIGEKAIVVTGLKSWQIKIDTLLKNYELEKSDLPISPGTVQQKINSLRQDLTVITNHEKAIDREIENLIIYLPKLKILADWYYWQKESYQATDSALATYNTAVFTGWCPANKVTLIKDTLKKITPCFELVTIKTKEEPPVEILNNKLFKPFESVTRLYGLPHHQDLDPTAFLAGFFFLFFGLCLTDVTYGLFLIITIALLGTIYRLPKSIKPLLSLLALGGLASVLVGIFFAGFAGFNISQWPLLSKWQLFDPIQNPLPVFYLALTLGFIQIVVGICLKIVRDAKIGQLRSGLLDNLPWLLFFTAIIFLVANKINWITLPGSGLILIITALLLVITQGRKESTLIKKLGIGVLSLYNIVGYFSDMLSYSRLLALGLSTTALAFSINMIAALVSDLIPVIGIFIAAIILIIGHLFNIIVNVLGAFVHSARLQFVEFFGKFLSGTGRPFRPFIRSERYVIIKN